LLTEDPAQLLSDKSTGGISTVPVARLKQRYALAVMYFHFGGPAWTLQTLPVAAGWLAGAANVMDECDWLAVVCNDDGLVTALEMGPQILIRLAGVLPSELGLLTALTTLDLSDKELVGTIPPFVYQNLVRLQYLDIGLNKLVSLSPDIAQWSQLHTLIVANNALYGALPTELLTLTNLQVLLLQKNPLASGRLLESIGSWPAMEVLDISSTNISGTLSPDVGTLLNLQALGAVFTSLTGSLPDEIGSCTALIQIAIGDMTGGRGAGSLFTGTIPNSIGLLTNLEGLAFPQLGLSGTIPSSLGALTKLQFLDLQGVAALTGTIPSTVGLWTDLRIFQVSGTALTGTIPSSLGQATNLEGAKFDETKLTGSMPDSICALSLSLGGELELLTAPCLSDNSTGTPQPAQVECASWCCTCSL
jgi:Leucine-rich repeat (LRR) protein